MYIHGRGSLLIPTQDEEDEEVEDIKMKTSFILYNPTLLPPKEFRNNPENWQKSKLLYFYPDYTNEHEKQKQTGLCEGVIEFMRDFTTEKDDYDNNPVDIISTTLFTIWVKEVETNLFLWMIVSHDNLYKDNLVNDSKTIWNSNHISSIFSDDDTDIFKDVLKLYYDLFWLFHNSFNFLLTKEKSLFRRIMQDFSDQFNKHFFLNEWGRTYFNNWVYRGFNILEIDSKQHLKTLNHLNSIRIEFPKISRMIVFYKEYFMYSDLPQEEVEILHTYLFGWSKPKHSKYISNWMDYGACGQTIKVKPFRKISNFSNENNEEEK